MERNEDSPIGPGSNHGKGGKRGRSEGSRFSRGSNKRSGAGRLSESGKIGSYERVGHVLDGYLSSHPRLKYEVKALEAVRIWPDMADEYVRLHTEAVMVKDRILYVHTDSSALASELTLREEEFRGRLNRALKMSLVQRIVFKSGRVAHGQKKGERDKAPPRPLTAKTLKEIEGTVKNVREQELREVLKRFFKETAMRNERRKR